jgi:hypothetical protein
MEDDFHDMLCDTDLEYDTGLESDRDTEAEIETAMRFFPNVLSRGKEFTDNDDDDDDDGDDSDDSDEDKDFFYPIQFLALLCRASDTWMCNLKAAPFIPLIARLTLESGVFFFGEEERGGLLIQSEDGKNALNYLMFSDRAERHNREHHQPIDDVYLQVLIKLRKLIF